MLYSHSVYQPGTSCHTPSAHSRQIKAGEFINLSDPSTSDSALVRRAQENPEEFGVLYERHVQKIYNYVYYRTGNEHDAEDLTARVFLRAMRHIPKYKERGLPFSAWLYRIAHNLVANWHRDTQRRRTVPLDNRISSQSDAGQPEKVTETNEQTVRLLQAIRALPDDRQQLLILKFVERLPNSQIASTMQRSEGAVKSLYHRTLLALRKDLSNGKQPYE